MSREFCQTCESLKEFYWLKLNQFLIAAGSSSAWPPPLHVAGEEELLVLKNESLDALRELMRHAKACYGLTIDDVTVDDAA
ncbi:MAG TPA: hypothetical protein VGL22_11320 [Terracidiphilus sp.]